MAFNYGGGYGPGNSGIGQFQGALSRGPVDQQDFNVEDFTNMIDTTTIDGIPRYLDKGSHDPSQHNAPVDPSGNPIPELRPRDEDIPLYGMPRTLSGTAFPVGNYVNKTVS